MAIAVEVGGHPKGMLTTMRKDRWWAGPVAVLLGLSAFVVYATWAAFQGAYYFADPYLSPFYSPVLFSDVSQPGSMPLGSHVWIGSWPSWWPAFLPASPAFLVLIFPGAFRFTCYYYRKAYYRAFTASPPACAVGARAPGKYRGETGLLLFQNLHRYALYIAVLYIFILYYDAFAALFKDGRFGIGVGTVVLFVNATLLGAYTFGCHSWRHLIGGRLDCFSCDAFSEKRHGAWKKVTWLNQRHQLFAWLSLFWVGFADFYVRMVSMGYIHDFNTW